MALEEDNTVVYHTSNKKLKPVKLKDLLRSKTALKYIGLNGCNGIERRKIRNIPSGLC